MNSGKISDGESRGNRNSKGAAKGRSKRMVFPSDAPGRLSEKSAACAPQERWGLSDRVKLREKRTKVATDNTSVAADRSMKTSGCDEGGGKRKKHHQTMVQASVKVAARKGRRRKKREQEKSGQKELIASPGKTARWEKKRNIGTARNRGICGYRAYRDV